MRLFAFVWTIMTLGAIIRLENTVQCIPEVYTVRVIDHYTPIRGTFIVQHPSGNIAVEKIFNFTQTCQIGYRPFQTATGGEQIKSMTNIDCDIVANRSGHRRPFNRTIIYIPIEDITCEKPSNIGATQYTLGFTILVVWLLFCDRPTWNRS